jgi:hypothetical protein
MRRTTSVHTPALLLLVVSPAEGRLQTTPALAVIDISGDFGSICSIHQTMPDQTGVFMPVTSVIVGRSDTRLAGKSERQSKLC